MRIVTPTCIIKGQLMTRIQSKINPRNSQIVGFCNLALATLSVFALSAPASAKVVVNVTRKQSNLYKVDAQNFWIKTKYCYQYGYGEEVALDRSDMVFLDSGTKCGVDEILKEVDLQSGNYSIKVSHEDSDLYSTLEGVLLRTESCFEYGYSEDAILRVESYGTVSLVFLDKGKKCNVSEVLSR